MIGSKIDWGDSWSDVWATMKSRWSESMGEVREKIGGAVTETAAHVVNKSKDALGSLVSGVNKVMPSLMPTITASLAQLSFRGSQGSVSALRQDIVLTEKFFEIAGTAPDKYGYPCCRYLYPGDLDGFALVRDPLFEISGTVAEEQALEELFRRGIVLDWSGG